MEIDKENNKENENKNDDEENNEESNEENKDKDKNDENESDTEMHDVKKEVSIISWLEFVSSWQINQVRLMSAEMKQGHKDIIFKSECIILRTGVWLVQFVDLDKLTDVMECKPVQVCADPRP